MHTYPFSEAFVVVAGPYLPMMTSSLSATAIWFWYGAATCSINTVSKIRIVPLLTLSSFPLPSHLCTAPPLPFFSFLPYHSSPWRWHRAANKVVGCWPWSWVGEVIYMHIKEVISYFSLMISYITLRCCDVMWCDVMWCDVILDCITWGEK